jgi:hypothetical protein
MNSWKRGNSMKEPKQQKSEEIVASRAAAVRAAWMERTRACEGARALLKQLEGCGAQLKLACTCPTCRASSLWQHTKALEVQKARIARLSPYIQRVVQNENLRCLVTDPAVLAAELIAGKPLDAIILEEQKQPQMDRLYKNLNFGAGPDIVVDPDSLVFFKQWDAERAAVQIITAAIKLQKKAVLAAVTTSMENFCRIVAQQRSETARQVLAVLAELQRIVAPDQDLAKSLDEMEIAALRPKPFPLQVLGLDAWTWLDEAVSAGMIDEAELTNLQKEQRSEPKNGSPAPEPWLQTQI